MLGPVMITLLPAQPNTEFLFLILNLPVGPVVTVTGGWVQAVRFSVVFAGNLLPAICQMLLAPLSANFDLPLHMTGG